MNEYLDLMQMPNTCIDEFVLSAFARMWSVRVAVLRTHGKGLSTDHSQFVYDQLEAQRTIFLLRHGHHFEWAHATSDSCDDPSCKRTNKRVSASHTPFGLPQVAAAAGSVVPDSLPQTSAPAAAPAGARLSNGGEEILQVLVGQLLEEYPGLDPERAEAALKLTKQGGKYSVYRASAKLPGVEGAPIVLRSPSPAQDTEDNEGASVRFTSGGERSSSSSSDDEGAIIQRCRSANNDRMTKMKMVVQPSANRPPRLNTAAISRGAATKAENVEISDTMAVADPNTWSKRHESVTRCKDSEEHKHQRLTGQHTICSAAESCTNKTCGTGSGRRRQHLKPPNMDTAAQKHQAAMAAAIHMAPLTQC
jgi:hypothetical protein